MYVTLGKGQENNGGAGGVAEDGGKRVGGWEKAFAHETSSHSAGTQKPLVWETVVMHLRCWKRCETYSEVIIRSYTDGCVEVIRVLDDVIEQGGRILLVHRSLSSNKRKTKKYAIPE